MDSQAIYAAVNDRYGASARASTTSTGAYGKTVAQAFGYSASDLSSIPAEANLGLSCGNPLAIAGLKEGETVIDLGSGAGFDVFLAAKKLGETGRAIGVDMNDDMLATANKNKQKTNANNVEFIKSQITSIPLPSAVADVIISNCVINLVPDSEKHLVFHEMHRLLKPGGRVAVSDLLCKKDMPERIKNDMALYVGCIAGASKVEEYERWLKEAGFGEVMVVDAGSDVNVYIQTDEEGNLVGGPCCGDGLVEGSIGEVKKSGGCCGPSTEKEGGCEKPAEKAAGSCCAPKKETKAASSCCGSKKEEKPASSCCAPKKEEKTTSSCCGPKKEEKPDGVMPDLKAKHPDLDLNEWVGSYKIYAVKPSA
ncbi:NAD(P)-binding protein [Delitschia confertaspora ATCC 74209]|uniref:Arsenite methyltransferase n=1 Tax=Delitschia confertaspora ATCC 74209 TaxID=1513339 RepID=A0A9P4JET8_9PLEO|nr:NAD(P)-binding protein [Delitschia confertaspora ATCC 74209]